MQFVVNSLYGTRCNVLANIANKPIYNIFVVGWIYMGCPKRLSEVYSVSSYGVSIPLFVLYFFSFFVHFILFFGLIYVC